MAKCPLLKKPCIKHDCEWHQHLIGKNPNSGADMDQWGCAIGWIPILIAETAQQVRHAGSSLDGIRNRIKESNDIALIENGVEH